MSNPRSMFGKVSDYATLAGKSCCCGRSWVGLNKTLARHADDPDESSCEMPSFVGPDEYLDAESEADEPTFVSSSLPRH